MDTQRDKTGVEDAAEAAVADVAQRRTSEMFRYSTWVHVGPNAENCEAVDEDKGESTCSDPLHFHAWIRLPNQYQHREIREKALAAKARRVRQLQDPESDAHAILEYELKELEQGGETAKEGIVDDILSKDMWRDMRETTADLTEDQDGEESKYKHITRDRERFRELQAAANDRELSDDERDEMEHLDRHTADFDDEFDRRYAERTKPQREALMAQDWPALIDQVRNDRIARDADETFMVTYNLWMYLAGTLDKPRGVPVWSSPDHFRSSAPEVVEAVQAGFEDIERDQAKDRQDASAEGNS